MAVIPSKGCHPERSEGSRAHSSSRPTSHSLGTCGYSPEIQGEFIVQVLRNILCHSISLVVHRHDVAFLSVRQAALPVAMPPNRPAGREH